MEPDGALLQSARVINILGFDAFVAFFANRAAERAILCVLCTVMSAISRATASMKRFSAKLGQNSAILRFSFSTALQLRYFCPVCSLCPPYGPARCGLICSPRKCKSCASCDKSARRANHLKIVSSPSRKNIPLNVLRPNQPHNSARLTRMRGARERHERAVGCGGREARQTCAPEAYGEVVWFWRRGAGVKFARSKLLAGDGGKRAVLREEHEVSRKAIAQGRPGCSRCTCMLVCAFVMRKLHTGPRVQRAPGLPCALSIRRGQKTTQNSGAMLPRERETISTSLRAQRSNPPLRLPRYGLLRCARNDVDGPQRTGSAGPRETGFRHGIQCLRRTTLRCNTNCRYDASLAKAWQSREQSGVPKMSLFKMQMTRQLSDYFFVYPLRLKRG